MTTKPRRDGECFTQSMMKMLSMPDADCHLVHGLPMGQRGEAKKVGRYPHAWVELDGMCWDPGADDWFPAILYYYAGEIEYTLKYTHKMMAMLVADKETYGPWDMLLLQRDDEIDAMRLSA